MPHQWPMASNEGVPYISTRFTVTSHPWVHHHARSPCKDLLKSQWCSTAVILFSVKKPHFLSIKLVCVYIVLLCETYMQPNECHPSDMPLHCRSMGFFWAWLWIWEGGWYFGWLSLSFSICIYFRVLHKHAGLTCSSVSLTRHQTSLVSVQSFRLWRARRGKPQRKSECEFVWWADLSLLTWCIFRPLCPSPGSKRSNEKLSSCRILHR